MSVIEIALLGVSLAMDAFAVSITTGITLKDLRWKHALKVGLFFGGFQFLAPNRVPRGQHVRPVH